MFQWVTVLINWLKTDMNVGGFEFSFFDFYIWVAFASILVAIYRRFFGD